MRPRLLSILLLLTVLGLVVQLIWAETGAVTFTLQQSTIVTGINDIQILNATYPALFNPNYTYTEFASVDLATVPRPSGILTSEHVIVGYYFVYDEHGIAWNYTEGQAREEVLVLMAYSSLTPPSSHRLQLNNPSIVVAAKSSNGFAHAYLFLMHAKV